MQRETLLDLFTEFSQFPDEFLIFEDGFRTHRYTYRDVGRAARMFALRLQANGVQQGERVLFWSENRPEWIAALWGCLLAGVVAVPVDYRTSASLVSRLGERSRAKLLLAGDEVPTSNLAYDLPVWRLSELAWTGSGDSPSQGAVQTGDLAEILFTSGATSEPKGVTITHRNVLANLIPVEREIHKYKKWGKPFFPLRFVNLLPLSHMFGQSMATFIPPMLPGITIFLRSFTPGETVRNIRKHRASVLVCVPKILEVLRAYVLQIAPEAATAPPPGEHWVLRWWRFRRVHRAFGWKFWSFVVGAAPLDPELEEFWRRMGFVVIQGYGLTETAPIVTLNHPFHTRKGSVGKPIGGVAVKIAPDGEILVRGDNVTGGYWEAGQSTADAFEDGWFRTGDIGKLDEAGHLSVLGRKKEMIVTPDGLNIFPEDVERVLAEHSGVRDAAVVGIAADGRERVHAVLVLESAAGDPEQILRETNGSLEEHQRIRSYSLWPDVTLPRTEGTGKLKRVELRQWVTGQGRAGYETKPIDWLEAALARVAPGRSYTETTTLDELGLSSLERIELMMALEQQSARTLEEASFTGVAQVAELRRLLGSSSAASSVAASPPLAASNPESTSYPRWNRSWAARLLRRINLPSWILPLARFWLDVRPAGLQHLENLPGPVLFAPNHQSHFDVPAILSALPARWRYSMATAMSKEFFAAHFYPERHGPLAWFTNTLNYYLGCLFFFAFPLPQREAGALAALRYAGELISEGTSVLIFPEGHLTDDGEIGRFQPGIAMMAARLQVPVVPVRLVGLDKVLHRSWRWPRRGKVEVRFGPPLRLAGENYSEIAKQVEAAVRAL